MTQPNGQLDLELYFLSEVLKLPALHYGFWDEAPTDDGLSLDSMRCAQGRFREELLGTIPNGVTTVLDVGCGIGDSSYEMARRGYDVTAISPDQNHANYFNGTNQTVHFECTRFEDFRSDSSFDLLYFSESLNYIDLDEGLRQCNRLTKPGSHLLVSCTFRSPDAPYPDDFEVCNLPYVGHAKAAGFELVSARDITPNVLPTVRLAHRGMSNFVLPLIGMGEMYIETRSPLKRSILGILLSKPKESMKEKLGIYFEETNPEYFARHMRYATLLFRSVDTQ